MNIGIIGSNGFIGRHLCIKYLQNGHNVFAFFNKHNNNIPRNCYKIPINKRIKERIDYLFFAIGDYTNNYKLFLEQISTIQYILTNLNFTRTVFISSTSVYGNHSDIIKVDSCFNNPNLYGISKIAQEFFIKASKSYSIIRPTYIYGEGMNRNSLIPKWLVEASQNKIITVYGDGSRQQDYLHIDDFVELCYCVANDDRNTILLAASGNSSSNIDLANLICKLLPETNIKHKGKDNTPSYEFDITETLKRYNWTCKYSLEMGLKGMIDNETFNL